MFVPAAIAAPSSDEPHVGDATIPSVAHPYDDTADADQAVEAAVQAAKAADKRTLIVFGANWCADCHLLAGVLSLDSVKSWAARHFEIVEVDVGRFNRNTTLAERFGVQLQAVPAIVVLTADGKVANVGETLALGDARTLSAQAIVDILARWASTPRAS
jgi:thiol-disulfide isomerase/thioredoxin